MSNNRVPSECAGVTVVTRDCLHFARALARSVRETHPGWSMYICLVDRPETPFEASQEPATVFFADELEIPHWKRFAFQYTGFELCCALKPFAMGHVLDLNRHRSLVYLDADLQVYAPLDSLCPSSPEEDVTLTPHSCCPSSHSDYSCVEKNFLRHGAFNAGLVGVANSERGRQFLAWWGSWTKQDCVSDSCQGLYVDQAFLNLVPGLFSGVRIERRPVFNVAYWNLHQRRLEQDADGRLLVDGQPLSSVHFSGFDPEQPERLTKWPHMSLPANSEILQRLTRAYAQRLDACGRRECLQWGYRYSRLIDGTPIDARWREAVRTNHAGLGELADPFDCVANRDLKRRLTEAEVTLPGRSDWYFHRVAQLEARCDQTEARCVQTEARCSQLEQQLAVAWQQIAALQQLFSLRAWWHKLKQCFRRRG